MKKKSEKLLMELLAKANIDKYDQGRVDNLRVRWLPGPSLFQVEDGNFDRWANSVALQFYCGTDSGVRALQRWINDE